LSKSTDKSVKKVTPGSVKASAKPKPRYQSEKKTFATLPKVPLNTKAQGAIAKLPRVFPGMSSRSTSSRSAGSVGVKSATHQSRSTVISAFSGQKKSRTTVGITQASVHSYKYLEGSIPTEVSGEQPSVCSNIGFDAGLISVSKLKERWTRHFVEALSFAQPLRGDDLSFLLEGLQKNFPQLSRIQDLEAYTFYKQIMRSGCHQVPHGKTIT